MATTGGGNATQGNYPRGPHCVWLAFLCLNSTNAMTDVLSQGMSVLFR